MTKHDPTEEAETLPGIPIAGSDLEQFPSVAPIVGGGAQSLDVSMQQVTSFGAGTFAAKVTVTISAVDVDRSYVIVQGSIQPPNVAGGASTWILNDASISWELTNPTTISWWTNTIGLIQRVRFCVVEYL